MLMEHPLYYDYFPYVNVPQQPRPQLDWNQYHHNTNLLSPPRIKQEEYPHHQPLNLPQQHNVAPHPQITYQPLFSPLHNGIPIAQHTRHFSSQPMHQQSRFSTFQQQPHQQQQPTAYQSYSGGDSSQLAEYTDQIGCDPRLVDAWNDDTQMSSCNSASGSGRKRQHHPQSPPTSQLAEYTDQIGCDPRLVDTWNDDTQVSSFEDIRNGATGSSRKHQYYPQSSPTSSPSPSSQLAEYTDQIGCDPRLVDAWNDDTQMSSFEDIRSTVTGSGRKRQHHPQSSPTSSPSPSASTIPIPVPNLTKKSRGRRVPTMSSLEDIRSATSGAGRKRQGMGGKNARMYLCEVEGCGKCFARGEHLKRHVRSIHTYEKREYFSFMFFCFEAHLLTHFSYSS